MEARFIRYKVWYVSGVVVGEGGRRGGAMKQ